VAFMKLRPTVIQTDLQKRAQPSQDVPQSLRELVTTYRQQHRLSLAQVAERLGIQLSDLKSLLNPQRGQIMVPTMTIIVSFAAALKVRPSTIMTAFGVPLTPSATSKERRRRIRTLAQHDPKLKVVFDLMESSQGPKMDDDEQDAMISFYEYQHQIQERGPQEYRKLGRQTNQN
jgi:transcriptional regulator with XRE-family HTH domain